MIRNSLFFVHSISVVRSNSISEGGPVAIFTVPSAVKDSCVFVAEVADFGASPFFHLKVIRIGS